MTSRELIKVITLIGASLAIHFIVLAGIPYRYESDIKFKRNKMELKIKPYRPFLSSRRRRVDEGTKKGLPLPGDRAKSPIAAGKELEEEIRGVTEKSQIYDELSQVESLGEEGNESVLADFLAKIGSRDMQRRLARIRSEKELMWKGEGISERDMGKGGTDDKGRGNYMESYLDPRVRLVVASYPPTSIENNHPPIIYPELKVKQSELQTGWSNVVIRIYTDENGKVKRQRLLRPLSGGIRENIFREHTVESIKGWTYEKKRAEIIIDVRYFVE